MGLTGLLTKPYGVLEAWVYDVFLAPAALDLVVRSGARPWEGLAPAARLLDVGCGGGHLIRHIARIRKDLEITGVDLSPGQLERARRRTAVVAARMVFVEATALALPFADGHFDAAISVGSIKHWPDRQKGLAECARVLRPGGALAVIEFDRDTPTATIEDFLRRWWPPAPLRRRLAVGMRRHVIDGSLSLEEVQALAADLPLDGVRARHVEGTPMLVLEARRRQG